MVYKQELILTTIEEKINASYLKNSNITDFLNISVLVADNVFINEDVTCSIISINAENYTCEEYKSELSEIINSLDNLKNELNEIDLNIANAVALVSTEVYEDIEVLDDLEIQGTMTVINNLTLKMLNNIPTVELYQELLNGPGVVIKGMKSFPSIIAQKLSVHSINGIPTRDIVFDTVVFDYEGIDLSNITRLEITGNLNFSYINDIHWNTLMKNVVKKSEPTTIPGETIVQGAITAHYAVIDYLNGLEYPNDYLQKGNKDSVEMSGEKYFETLAVDNIKGIKTINGISVEEFILLNNDVTLKRNITFHNLKILGYLQIDGKIIGCQNQPLGTLGATETHEITADVIIKKLRVDGYIKINHSINGKTWADYDDLITKNDNFAKITGKKTFLGEVKIGPGLRITTGRINGRHIDEFVTLNTYQELPNLQRIDANASFENVIESDMLMMERILTRKNIRGSPQCINKILVFKEAPVINTISADIINRQIPGLAFAMALNRSFSNIIVDNMRVKNLHVKEIVPTNVNGINFEKFQQLMKNKNKKSPSPDFNIRAMELQDFYAESVDGQPEMQRENSDVYLPDDLLQKIIEGTVSIRNLIVTGPITVKSINGKPLVDIYNTSTMGKVIFDNDVFIEDLTMHGLLNGVNFSEVMSDAVKLTDKDVIITGKKKFNKIICNYFDASTWNNRSIDDILDPDKHQILTGPIIVKGTVTVEDYFDPRRQIGDTSFQIIKEFNSLGNKTYTLHGNFLFTNNSVDINHLIVSDYIQGINFTNFIESLVFLNGTENVTISGAKTFKNSVTFNNFTITEKFNNIDLEKFFKDVIFIDKPFSINSTVIFQDNLTIVGDIMITKNLRTKKIMNINFEELQKAAIYTNKREIIPGTIKCKELIFQSDIEVERINNIDMKNLITLHREQIISNILRCRDIAVGKLDIEGTVNGQVLSDIFDNTLLLTGNQIVRGNITFLGNVEVLQDFNAELINGISPNQWISFDKPGIILGNFNFTNLLVLNNSLKILGKLNNISIAKYQGFAITHKSLGQHLLSDKLPVDANVNYPRNITGSLMPGIKQLSRELKSTDLDFNVTIHG